MSAQFFTRLALFIGAVLFIVFGSFTTYAQLPAGYFEIQGKRPAISPFDERGYGGCFLVDGGIVDEAMLKPLMERKECADEIKALAVDLKKETLIAYRVGGDCHMSIRHKLFRNDDEKKLLLVVNNLYGGCRAGGSRKGWIVLDKLPADYTLDIKIVRVDKIHGINAENPGEFKFPKQPSNIKPVLMESREVDMKGCLPMTGQSRWILSKGEHLKEALDTSLKDKECREHFASLAIDFDKYVLAGYNLRTGHCSAPPVQAKIYNDAGENRYIIDFEYDEPRGSCHALIYHPVWLLVPRVLETYSFEFRNNGKASY